MSVTGARFGYQEPKGQQVLVISCCNTSPECFENGSRARYSEEMRAPCRVLEETDWDY